MNLDSLKEILLRKSKDIELHKVIRGMSNDKLSFMVSETLEKMGLNIEQRSSRNAIVEKFKRLLLSDPDEAKDNADLVYDALSHHASQYKAALKNKDEETADLHATQIHKIMNLYGKLKNTKGETGDIGIDIEAPNPSIWERSHSSIKGNKSTNKPRGWARISEKHGHWRGAPDISYGNKKLNEQYKNRAYPLEEVKVNGKYIHIDDDTQYSDVYVPHALDDHPVLKYYSNKSVKDEMLDTFHRELNEYHGGEKFNNLMANIESLGESYQQRGLKISQPVHSPLKSYESSASKLSDADVDSALSDILGESYEPEVKQPEVKQFSDADVDSALSDILGEESTPEVKQPEVKQFSDADVDSALSDILGESYEPEGGV